MRIPHRPPAMGSDQPGGSRVAAWRERRPLSWSPLKLARNLVRCPSGRLLGLSLPVESVGQRDGIEIVLVAIASNRRVYVENHGHLARLARFQALLGEAEAVDLVEVAADCRRRHVV